MFKKDIHSSRKFKPLKILFFGIVFIAFIAAVSWLVMFLWNAILVDVAGVKPLNIWKAAGLLILFKILFGRIGGRRSWKNSKRTQWRNKWMDMNSDERMEAKTRWKEYCKRRNSEESNE